MSPRTTIVLVVLLVIALGAAMFFAAPPAAAPLPAAFLPFSKDEVRAVVVKNRAGEVRLERDAVDRERWNVRAGATPVRADAEKVDEVLNGLSRLQPKNVFAPAEIGPEDRKTWGLEDPSARVTLEFDGRKTEAVFGRRDSTGRNAWAQRDAEPEVFLVVADPLENLERLALAEVRASRPLPWSAHEVRSISIRRNDGVVLEVAHAASAVWEVTSPFRGAADPVAMSGLVQKVLDLTAKEFVADGSVDLEKHGLADPLATISIVREGREQPVVVRISKPGEDGNARFAVEGEQAVASCEPDLPRAIAALDPAALRDRNLLRLGWTKLDSIEFVHPEKGWKLLRVLERWDVEKPERSHAEDAEVERLLERLRTLEVAEFLDGADAAAMGLGSAEACPVRLELVGLDAGGNRTLLLGKRREDGRVEARVAAIGASKEPHAPVVVPPDLLDVLEGGWLQWRTREVLEVSLAEVRGLSKKDARFGEQSFLREGNAWKATPGGPAPDGEALTAALTQLLHVQCSGYEGKATEGLEKWGLGETPASAAITITLQGEGQAAPRTRTLTIGSSPEGEGFHYGRVDGSDLVFRLPNNHVQGANVVSLPTLLKADWRKGEKQAQQPPPPPPAPAPAPVDAVEPAGKPK